MMHRPAAIAVDGTPAPWMAWARPVRAADHV